VTLVTSQCPEGHRLAEIFISAVAKAEEDSVIGLARLIFFP